MRVSAIVAMAENNVIGRDGDLPWDLPDDMRFFKETTMGHPIITGRKNYECIPERFRPLPGRTNIVITRSAEFAAPGAIVVDSLAAAIEKARALNEEEIFIIGGGQIFQEAILHDVLDRVYLTVVHAEVDGDVHFPDLGEEWVVKHEQFHPADVRHAHAFTFKTLER